MSQLGEREKNSRPVSGYNGSVTHVVAVDCVDMVVMGNDQVEIGREVVSVVGSGAFCLSRWDAVGDTSNVELVMDSTLRRC